MRNERRLLDQLTPEQASQLEPLLTAWLARFEAPLPVRAAAVSIAHPAARGTGP